MGVINDGSDVVEGRLSSPPWTSKGPKGLEASAPTSFATLLPPSKGPELPAIDDILAASSTAAPAAARRFSLLRCKARSSLLPGGPRLAFAACPNLPGLDRLASRALEPVRTSGTFRMSISKNTPEPKQSAAGIQVSFGVGVDVCH